MGKKGVAVLVIGLALGCAACMVGFIMVMKSAAQRREARNAEMQAREAEQRALDLERFAVAPVHVDWATAAEAFSKPHTVAADDAAEFSPLFESLGRALAREDEDEVEKSCDLDRLLDEIIRVSGWEAGRPALAKADLRADFQGGFGRRLIQNKSLRWQRSDIRRVEWSANRSEATVFVVHRPAPGDSFKAIWWLVRRRDGWRAFDTADLYLGTRFTRDSLILNPPEVLEAEAREPGRYSAVRSVVASATRAMNAQNADEADRLLAPIRGFKLAAEDAAIRAIVEGRILAKRRDTDAAIQKFEEAEKLSPGMPAAISYRASTYADAARYPEALEAARAYLRRVGPDVHGLQAEAYALEGLGRNAEAAEGYRGALDDDPDTEPAFFGLRRTLPAGKKNELATRIARAANPRKLYDAAITDARRDNDEAAITALLDGLRRTKPDDPRGLSDDIRRQVKAEKFTLAAKLLERGLKSTKREDRDSVLDAYLFAMLGADKALEAYAAVPAEHAAHTFRTLGDDLEDEISDRDDEKPAAQVKQLTELIAAHRKQMPADPWLWYYEGALQQHAKEYEKAEKTFAAGAAKLPEKTDPDDPDGRDWDTDRFRSHRVVCLFKLKKGLDAYRTVGPAIETFSQLAGLYDGADDFDGLETLIKTHREAGVRDPERSFWQAHLLYRKKEYDKAVPAFQKYLDDSKPNAPGQWRARGELLRSVLRTKPADAAKTLAAIGTDKVDYGLRAAVAAASGNRAELERLLAEVTKNGAKVWFYSDEDFRRFIYQEKYRDLRTKYPDPNPPPKLDS
jgi:tetratricopeptide (TPR) repeat protein